MGEQSPIDAWPRMRNDRRLAPPRVTGGSKQLFLRVLGVLLLIYAVLGRSGAHIGIPLGGGSGSCIGDLVLLFGLVI